MVTGTSGGYNIDVGPRAQQSGRVEKHCWNRRTKTEKCLTCWYLFTVIIVILFIIFYLLHVTGVYIFPGLDFNRPNDLKCDTQKCDERGGIMYCLMDHSIKPCDNFYQHVCGNYKSEANKNPSVFQDQINEVNHVLKGLLDAPTTSTHSKAAKNVKRFYVSCKDAESMKSQNLIKIVNFMHREHFELYTEGMWDTTPNYDITDDIIKLLKLSQGSIFHFTLGFNVDNPSTLIAMVKPCTDTFDMEVTQNQNNDETDETMEPNVTGGNETETTLGTNDNAVTSNGFNETLEENNMTLREIYQDHQAYQLNMKLKIMEHFVRKIYFENEDVSRATIYGMKQFIRKLHQIKPSEKKCKSPVDYLKSLSSTSINLLKTDIPQIDWNRIFIAVIGREPSVDEVLQISHVDFLFKLNNLLSETDSRLVHNSLVALLYVDKFHHIITREVSNKKDDFCLLLTKKFFPNELSSMYIKTKTESEFRKLKEEIEHIENYIRRPMIDRISGSNWMDQATIDETIEKVVNMKSTFVAPNFTFYENEFEDQEMAHDFISNVILRLKHKSNRERSLYQQDFEDSPVDLIWKYLTNPVSSRFIYSVYFNRLDMPMSFLTPPLYDADLPRYYNFATIGLAIAHEIAHSISGLGLDFNEAGYPVDWVAAPMKKEIKKQEKCFIHQYSKMGRNITFEHLINHTIYVDGNYTLNENLADNVAIDIAYEAYQDWLMDKVNEEDLVEGQEQLFPQFASKSPSELFFIAAAQGFCSNQSTAEYLISTYLDVHTTDPERVNGFLMNSQQFSNAFQCHRGSKMNPNRKCSYL